MDIKQTIAKWVRDARTEAKLSGEQLGAKLAIELRTQRGHSKGNISHWELGKHEPSIHQLRAISKITGVPLPNEILAGAVEVSAEHKGPHPLRRKADFELHSEEDTDREVGRIEYWDARGSCGGGFLNYDELPKGHLVKEASFFRKYDVKPENVFAIYADGDSMADYIVDGDIVIFDKTKTEPKNGEIFCIEHPDGLKIKTLRRGIDGSWVLESKNPDKRSYPDERIEPGQEDLLKIHGEFIYRQGG